MIRYQQIIIFEKLRNLRFDRTLVSCQLTPKPKNLFLDQHMVVHKKFHPKNYATTFITLNHPTFFVKWLPAKKCNCM